MNSPTAFSHTKVDKAMNPEQFTQIVEAILAGKYSWACVLLLRSAGYNPLNYIPYRTYNRLIKENSHSSRMSKHQTPSLNASIHHSKVNEKSSQKCLSKISDLAVLEEAVDEQHAPIRGGSTTMYSHLNWHYLAQKSCS